jgi:hypothetical protein
MRKLNKNLFCYIVASAITLIFISNLQAATLTIGSASGSPGTKNISIPINLTSASGERVCGFNFDLSFDTSKLSFKDVTLGSAATQVGKSLSYSQPSSNTIRVVVVGLNQNIIGDGTVLTFTFDVLSNAPAGKTELAITKPSLSDQNGKALAVNIKDGELEVLR